MSAPDSEAWDQYEVEVMDTPEKDGPKYGSVTIYLSTSPNRGQSIRMSRSAAEDLLIELNTYFEEN